MAKVSFIGAGNVAWHLAHKLDKLESWKVKYIYSRGKSSKVLAKSIDAKSTKSLRKISKSDLIIIAVPDSAIPDIVDKLKEVIKKKSSQIIVHTSGSVSSEIFLGCCRNYGVFYPLQSL